MEGRPLRIAMWSGPRNISTAMMRAWGNRPDTFVCDEPLYAHYLAVTRRDHPAAEEVIAHYENDWRKVVQWLTGEVPEGKTIFYQKHMSHHMVPQVGRAWLEQVTNCFLIRDPRAVITSYVKIAGDPTLEDVGFAQLAEIFNLVRRATGTVPPVVDAKDVLTDPPRLLGLLCDALGVDFSDAMLSWPPGPRASDGIWAKHWYGEVEKSTSFRPYRPKPDQVPERLAAIYDQCVEYYQQLYEHRLR